MTSKIINWFDHFKVEEEPASVCGCVTTLLAYLAVVAYIVVVVMGWLNDPANVTVNLGYGGTAPTQVLLRCDSGCDCAYAYKFSQGECSKLEGGVIKANEQKLITLCRSEVWDEGVALVGGVSSGRAGKSAASFALDADADDINFAPLPATRLVENVLTDDATKIVVMRRIGLQDLTSDQPDVVRSIMSIGFVNDGTQCGAQAPTCSAGQAEDIDALDRFKGPSKPTLPMSTPSNQNRKRQLTQLNSCYLLQLDAFVVDYQFESSFSAARVFHALGGAHDAAFVIAGWLMMLATCVGVRKASSTSKVEMQSARP